MSHVIDGAVNGVARAIAWGGWFLRLMQSGQTQHYALGMALGAVCDSDPVLYGDSRRADATTDWFPWLTSPHLPAAGGSRRAVFRDASDTRG